MEERKVEWCGRRTKIQILLSINFDAVSGFSGSGAAPTNNMSDYSSGYFADKLVFLAF
jgi:hypothetical protein